MNSELGRDFILARDEDERKVVDSALKEALYHVQKPKVEAKSGTKNQRKPLIKGHGRHI